jgi:hypothetical protein
MSLEVRADGSTVVIRYGNHEYTRVFGSQGEAIEEARRMAEDLLACSANELVELFSILAMQKGLKECPTA